MWLVDGDSEAPGSRIPLTPWTEADNVLRPLLRLVELQVRPVVLSQQLTQRTGWAMDGWMCNHCLHIPQSAPGCVWRKHLEWLPLLAAHGELPTRHIGAANAP
jgi:hypothetical protein